MGHHRSEATQNYIWVGRHHLDLDGRDSYSKSVDDVTLYMSVGGQEDQQPGGVENLQPIKGADAHGIDLDRMAQ
jgi:hypothetical protein